MSDVIIKFTGVTKAFGPKVIYRDLNFEVRRGRALTVLGGSGVGKSVMLKMLIGLLKPDSGSILFDGQEVTKMSEAELTLLRRRVAMLFQGGALFDSLSVGQNVAYALHEHFYNSMSLAEINERVEWALDLVGLPGVAPMAPADLSGGMRKRVGLARSIALQPEVVLYDEPTTGLDPINTARVNHLITGLKQKLNITSIVVTHDMTSAFSIADDMAMVHEGRIICAAPKEQFRNVNDTRVQDFIHGRAPVDEDVATLLKG